MWVCGVWLWWNDWQSCLLLKESITCNVFLRTSCVLTHVDVVTSHLLLAVSCISRCMPVMLHCGGGRMRPGGLLLSPQCSMAIVSSQCEYETLSVFALTFSLMDFSVPLPSVFDFLFNIRMQMWCLPQASTTPPPLLPSDLHFKLYLYMIKCLAEMVNVVTIWNEDSSSFCHSV